MYIIKVYKKGKRDFAICYLNKYGKRSLDLVYIDDYELALQSMNTFISELRDRKNIRIIIIHKQSGVILRKIKL